MKWHFPKQLADQVETEVTQRDQFDNDSVNLSETIVREAIQNSLDAAINHSHTVKVSFKFLNNFSKESKHLFQELLNEQRKHAEASALDLTEVDFDNPSALVIEDFGTTGLTGSVDTKDDNNFSDFWRRHGKSHKTGRHRGRWGLGKLVYSTTSLIGAFFGVTRRADEPHDHLMGQAVLNLRDVEGTTYTPHGFFCDLKNEGDPVKRIPVPVQDQQFVAQFTEAFRLSRREGPGLSIVIPFPNPQLKEKEMIGISIVNYFYPIIAKKLVLCFGEVTVDHSNIRALARKYAHDRFRQMEELFDFIDEALMLSAEPQFECRAHPVNENQWSEKDFSDAELKKLRLSFSAGEIVGFQLPIIVKRKNGQDVATFYYAFLKRPETLDNGMDLYVRGGLTLPAESKFRHQKALAMLVAEEETICDFLGDAENAAHTKWTTNTEKLRRNFRSTQAPVSLIKNSLVQLYDVLADITEEIDENALNQFFWYEEPKTETKNQSRTESTPTIPEIPRKPPTIRVTRKAGGFSLTSDTGLAEEMLPLDLTVKLAYDISKGDAFKNWSHFDFDIGDHKEIMVQSEGGVDVASAEGQTLQLTVSSLDFSLVVLGFDENRDLKVKLVKENSAC